MQLVGKFIAANAVDETKIRLSNTGILRARNAANSSDVSILYVDSSNNIQFSSIPYAAGTPTNNNQLANVGYVLQVAAGLRTPKDAVQAVSAANITIGTGTLLTVDGYQTVAGDRVLLTAQTTATENGIYVAGTGAWSRSTDANVSADVTQGMSTWAVNGTTYGKTGWLLTTANPIVLGTTALTFVQVPIAAALTAGNGIAIASNTVSVSLAASSGLAFSSGHLLVQGSATGTTQNRTIKINSSGEVAGIQDVKDALTLNSTDITNQYKDLSTPACVNSINLTPSGGLTQIEGTDYTLSYTGGAASVTRVSFAGDLATGGNSALVSGDVLYFQYGSLANS